MALEGFGGVFVWQIAQWHEVAVCQNCVEDGPVELIGMLVIDSWFLWGGMGETDVKFH